MTNEATTPEATTDAASPLQPIVRRDHQMTPEDLMYDLRSRINLAHANTIGTESWERKQCANAIEALLNEIEILKADAPALSPLPDSLFARIGQTPKCNGYHEALLNEEMPDMPKAQARAVGAALDEGWKWKSRKYNGSVELFTTTHALGYGLKLIDKDGVVY